jgi:hypothetical protein
VMMAYLFRMGLFAEMKMLGKDVLEEVDEEKSGQDIKERVFAGDFDGFGDDFHERDGQHVAGTQREEILQIFARPSAIDNEIAAQQIPACGDQAENGGESDTR